ncbi:MAG: RNA 3'-terminal phosphate cyclase [Candidatus Aenigmatarchaeota archaeon]
MIEINGSYGEGGGQILRTALSLSCITGKPFRIFHIRKGREKPGLMPQHLTSIMAAKEISDAYVEGGYIGSTDLIFSPRKTKAGEYSFDIGTAGSTLLLLQTIIPPLLFSEHVSKISIKGGTHVPFSPCYDYIEKVFAPFLNSIGIRINLKIKSYGFYPKGGGFIEAEIYPADSISSVEIVERGRLIGIRGVSSVANLPLSIAERQRASAKAYLKEKLGDWVPIDIKTMDVPSPAEGTFVFLLCESDNVLSGFSSLGRKGKSAERVGEEAASELTAYIRSDGALDPHLSDQIVIYLAMASSTSRFTTSSITDHLLTNLWTIGQFFKFKYSVEGQKDGPGLISITPAL